MAKEFGWYNRNTGYNPYMSEGKKTAALEICEQLTLTLSPSPSQGEGKWIAPDRIFVPVGDGCIIGGIHKGLKDLRALGWIDAMPKIMGIQAAGSSALVDAWERGLQGWEMTPQPSDTIADSISAGLPRDRNKALAAVRETGGAYLRVTDQEILDAIPVIARNTGVFSEPAAAAAYAGLVKAVAEGLVDPQERIVVLLTGSGLKDIQSAMKTVPQPPIVAPNLEAVKAVLGAGETGFLPFTICRFRRRCVMEKQAVISYPIGLPQTMKLSDEKFSETIGFWAAAKLYELGRLSAGKAAGLAGMERLAFLARLITVEVPAINLQDEEIAAEIEAALEISR